MAIVDDWDIDFTDKRISHIDGNIDWDTGTGTVPAADEYILDTFGCKNIVMKNLVAFTGTAGTDLVTNVVNLSMCGVVANNDTLVHLESVCFDGVVALCTDQGFKVGDTVTGATSTRTGVIRAIEFNEGVAGEGKLFGVFTGGGSCLFTCNENLQVSSVTKALAMCTGSGNNDWAGLVNVALLATPGTNNTATILNFDNCGTVVPVPEGAKIGSACMCSADTGTVHKTIGASAGTVGSLIINCTVGTWINNDNIWLQEVVKFTGLVSGQVFSVGDVITGVTSLAQARVLSIVDDGDCTGKLVSPGIVGGPFTDCENLQVGGVTKAVYEMCASESLDSFTDVNGAIRNDQRPCQGGIYASTHSLNVRRKSNEFYSFLQDTFDELGALDDQIPMSAQVSCGQYTLVNSWQIPDLSMRFLEAGSLKTNDNNCVWTNYQSLGTIEDIGDKGFLVDATDPTPQPNLYAEQATVLPDQFWLEGNVDILLKNKTKKDTRYLTPAVNALGQLIDCGITTVYDRSYFNTYDFFCSNTLAGTVPIPLNTADDANNNTGQFSYVYGAGGGLTIGEEITGGTSGAIGIVSSENLCTNLVEFGLKSTTQFTMCEVVTGSQSGATTTIDGVDPLDVVAGYCSTIRVAFAQEKATGGSVTGGKFQTGEPITQAVSSATGFIVGQNTTGSELVFEVNTGTFNCTDIISDDVGPSTYTPTGTATSTTACIDLGDGSGNHVYNAALGADVDSNGTGDTILRGYEWTKFLTRKESVLAQGNLGLTGTDTEGRIYKALVSTYPVVKADPFGSFAGGKMFGAQGLYIDKCDLATADLQNIQLIDTAGTVVNPPNLQVLTVSGLVMCDTVSVYRTTGACSTTILRAEWDVGVGACDNQSADTTIVVGSNTRTVPLCVDVPNTGVLRVQDPNEAATTTVFLRFPYNAVNRSTNTFTLSSGTIGSVTMCTDLRNDDDVFVVFIEEDTGGTSSSNTIQFCSNIPLLARVREKGIIPFQTIATFTSSGVNIGAVRNADTIVDLP